MCNKVEIEITMLPEQWKELRDRFPIDGKLVQFSIGPLSGEGMMGGAEVDSHGFATLFFQSTGRWEVAPDGVV